MTDRLLQRISIDPACMRGKPCIKGTRIWVSLILDFLAEGMTEAELLGNIRANSRGRVWRRSPMALKRPESTSFRPCRNRVNFKLDENLSRQRAESVSLRGYTMPSRSESKVCNRPPMSGCS